MVYYESVEVEKWQRGVLMTENIIMNIIPKLKQLDVNKLYLVEEAMNHCLAVQSLEKIKNEREIVKKYVQYETEISV